jgi:hypothetical protein
MRFYWAIFLCRPFLAHGLFPFSLLSPRSVSVFPCFCSTRSGARNTACRVQRTPDWPPSPAAVRGSGGCLVKSLLGCCAHPSSPHSLLFGFLGFPSPFGCALPSHRSYLPQQFGRPHVLGREALGPPLYLRR